MSISTTATKDSYAGNNSIVTQYPITFKYFEESHISVYFDGVLQTKGAGADYVMGGDGTTSTGYITTNVAQAGTVTVAITLDVPFDQPVVLQETGSLPAKTIEVEGFDRLNMQVRRVWRKLQDVLTFNTDEAGASTGTADNLIGFDGSGDITEIPNTTFVQTADGIGGNGDVTVTTPSTSQVLAWNGSAWVNTTAGNGDALTTSGLDQFAATTSLGLKDTISDETGSGSLVFATSPALVTPDLGIPSAVDLTNATNYPETNGTVQGTGVTTLNIRAADEGLVAGNARGEESVDLQMERDDAAQVASGVNSVLIGGKLNTAAGGQSAVVGGGNNDAFAYASSIIGGNNHVIDNTSNYSAIVGGFQHNIEGSNCLTAGGAVCDTKNFNGVRMFPDATYALFDARQANEFSIQASALRLEDGNEAVGKVLTCNHVDGSSNWAAPAKVVYTVATLPATPAQGDVAIVTDALTPAFLSAVASGGAVVTPVFYNGTAWIVG